MKRIAAFLVFTCIILQWSNSFAQNTDESAYISGHAGGNFAPDFDPGFAVGGAIGYKSGNHFRIEGEVAFRTNEVKGSNSILSQDVSALSLMGNAYFDFNFNSPLKPYIGAGVGFADVRSTIKILGVKFSENDTVFAYQLMAGLGYEISPKTTLTLGYRYFASGEDAEFNVQGFEERFESHEILVGFRLRL